MHLNIDLDFPKSVVSNRHAHVYLILQILGSPNPMFKCHFSTMGTVGNSVLKSIKNLKILFPQLPSSFLCVADILTKTKREKQGRAFFLCSCYFYDQRVITRQISSVTDKEKVMCNKPGEIMPDSDH